MKVLKFGGSSISTNERIRNCIEIILKSEDVVAVVLSAFGGVTDNLLKISDLAINSKRYETFLKEIKQRHLDVVKDLISIESQKEVITEIERKFLELESIFKGISLVKELSLKTQDLILSFGEFLSAYIIWQAVKQEKEAEFLDARDLIKTDDNFGNARINYEFTYKNITDFFKNNSKLQVVTGFIGSSMNNITTTLGRGGSDLTASVFGAALNVEEIQIWTDVDGILTANPNKVPEAFPINHLTYEEAMELSHFGAKVIYPPTMQPALNRNIPIIIKNTFNLDFKGTLISFEEKPSKSLITGISSISDIALLRLEGAGMVGVPGIAKRLFEVLSEKKINVILITQASSEHTICFAIKSIYAKEAKKAIEEEFNLEIQAQQINEVIIEENLSIIAVVGKGMRKKAGSASKFFNALGKYKINVEAIAQGSSELNISTVIREENETKALNALHKTFFMKQKEVDVFIVGVGTIGSELIDQINKSKFLNNGINIKAISNSKKMLLGKVPSDNWKKALDKSEQKADIVKFINYMETCYGNNVFVDCTSSDFVVKYYEEILSKGFSIVTPNKKANSDRYNLYKRIRTLSENGAKFFYETNAGAGLPVIVLAKDIMQTGDKIIKIEAVLSGTLSFIFNSFKNRKFSEIVKEAQQKGYTEPDPREDLNGLDVARKMLILARETGLEIELEDIEVENLVPEECRKAETVEEFFELLKEYDDLFEQRRLYAEKKEKVLRYVAKLENNKVNVALQEVDKEHPFYALGGADNMISFTTERYKERPLVVRGPGAGAKVTAAGVFADILKIVS